MTVSTEIFRSEHQWTGVETSFNTGWPAILAAHVKGVFRNPAGVETTLVQGVNYTVSISAGTRIVTCTPVVLPPAPGVVVFYRQTPATVDIVLQDNQNTPASVYQALLDAAALRDAEARGALSRALVLPPGASDTGIYDAVGRQFENVGAPTAPTHVARLVDLQGVVAGEGNVPSPAAGQVGNFLLALATNVFGWANALDARAALGGTTLGQILFTAANASAARTALEGTTLGQSLFTAANASAARTALEGTALGQSLFTASSAFSARSNLMIPSAYSFSIMHNSPAANQLTIVLTHADGTAISAADPMTIWFRSATAGSAVLSPLVLTAPVSLVLSAGSTLGFLNAEAWKFWVVVFNDAGTARLAVITPRNGLGVLSLPAQGIASAMAEGGAGAADSAQIFYANAPVTNKPYNVVGSAEFLLTVSGNWNSAPTNAQVWMQGAPLPGQKIHGGGDRYTAASTVANNLSASSDVLMTSAVGTQILSSVFNPSSPAHLHRFDVDGNMGVSAAAWIGAGLFLNAEATARAQNNIVAPGAEWPCVFSFNFIQCLQLTGPQTAKVRVGTQGNTGRISGISSARLGGGAQGASLIITEIVT